MILKIELEDNQFVDFDFEDILYVSGYNQNLLWKLYRSLYFYFQKAPELTQNIYGDNGIEVLLDNQKISSKHNKVFFIDSRNSIYEEMIYKKGNMIFNIINEINDDISTNRFMEKINDEVYKLNFLIQEKLNVLSDSLTFDIQDINFLELMKNNLEIGYFNNEKSYPLSFMSTDELIDEYLKFLEYELKRTSDTFWVVTYNLSSYLSKNKLKEFINQLKILTKKFSLKVIYIGNDLNDLYLDSEDIRDIVVAADNFEQILPFEELKRSITNNYPNEFELKNEDLVESFRRIVPFIGKTKDVYLSNKDLVLLKVVNHILSLDNIKLLKNDVLTSAETEFLESND
ncbi:CRISPR-associated protein Csn2-St [Companilactobacillus sp. DQM5]|uniref:CRISPR-associated protein Csn2-St n=1 Tax=Companilactobacillus sp. DQM5 TaxID=3463359 RepID=UPI00405A165D